MDYQPLYQKLNSTEINDELSAQHRSIGLLRIGIRVLLLMPIAGLFFALFNNFSLSYFIIVALIIYLVLYMQARDKLLHEIKIFLTYTNFAKANGLTYINESQNFVNLDSIVSHKPLTIHMIDKGVIFYPYNQLKRFDVIGDSDKMAVYSYDYIPKENSRNKPKYLTVSVARLSRPLPHLVFDNIENNSLFLSNLPVSFKKSQKLSLESNFDKYFTLYTPDGYKIDALSFITPEVIETIINNRDNMDIEIVDDYLYLYITRKLSVVNLEDALTRLKLILAEIDDNISTYSDSHLAVDASRNTKQEQIQTSGKRLRESKIRGIIILLLVGVVAMVLSPLGLGMLVLFFIGIKIFKIQFPHR